jgi:tetratricopeptide (TPR) repeat protein
VPYCQQAGARAYDRAAFREAVAYFEQALQALAHLPEPSDTRVLAIEIRLALDRPLDILAEHGRRLALLGEADALARALDDRVWLGRVLARMAIVLRQMGNLDGAIAAGQQALELAVALGDRSVQAEAHYQQALALAEALGMRPLQAHCHHGLGTLYAATGQREQARTELAATIALYRAMDMTFWLPQTEAALAQVAGRP